MYLSDEHNVSRHAPYKKLIRDENDSPVGLLPQAFEMREALDEKALSVNWLEFYGGDHDSNIVKVIKSFRKARKKLGKKVGALSAFGIGNAGKIMETCIELQHPKVRVLFEEKKASKHNKSHATIIRLPMNDQIVMDSLATEVFTEIVPNKYVP